MAAVCKSKAQQRRKAIFDAAVKIHGGKDESWLLLKSNTTIQATGTGTVHKLCKLLHMNVLKHHMRHERQYFPGGVGI